MKILYNKVCCLYKDGQSTLTGNVTIDTFYTKFQFGAFSLSNSVVVEKESSYDDVNFRTFVKYTQTNSDHSFGICLRGRTDAVNAENIILQITSDSIKYYRNGSLIQTVAYAHSLQNTIVKLEVRRKEDTYTFYVNDSQVYTSTSLNFKQNVSVGIFGHNSNIKLFSVRHQTESDNIRFGIIGDSISNNSYLIPPNTLRGKLNTAGFSTGEFSGDANIAKDALDSIHEILAIAPEYAIIMLGHNDQLFNTGNLLDDLTEIKTLLLEEDITPIFCTLAYATDINISIPNTIIRENFFGIDLHIELEGELIGSDTTDGVHPNVSGTTKLSTKIGAYLQTL